MIIEGKQKIWADYQKDIPDDHYFYVRSCIRQVPTIPTVPGWNAWALAGWAS